MHQGSIQVTSKVDEGSCFTVAIPLGKDHLPAERLSMIGHTVPMVSVQSASIEEVMSWPGLMADATSPAPSWPIDSSDQEAVRILLVDDNADMLDYLKRLLSRHYQVEAVSNGEAALLSARSRLPDLILTDIMMPGLDGFGLLKALRDDPRTNSVSVMLLSARVGEEASIEGFQAGADDYLIKPFSARELLSRVSGNLRLARLNRIIRQSEAQYRWLIENTTEAIWRFDMNQPIPTTLSEDEQIEYFYRDCYLSACNEGMARLFGYDSADQMIGMRLADMMPVGETQNTAYIRSFIKAGYKIIDAETIEVNRLGQTKYILNNLVGVVEGGCLTGAWGTSRDITERKRAELEREQLLILAQQAQKEAEESQARLRFMAESVPQKIFTTMPNGAVDYLNQQWMEFSGLAFDEIKGWGWQQLIHPDDFAENQRCWQHSLATGEPLQLEHRFRRADGVYRWHLSRVHAMRDDNGKIMMWIGSDTDIDDQKKVQEQKDEFLSVAAHELKTPITSLRGFSQMLLRQYQRNGTVDPVQLQLALRTIDEQSSKLTQLLAQLLDISRLEAGRLTLARQTTDLASLINNVADTMQRNNSQQTIAVKSPGSLMASVDPIRLEQVLVNLIDNAFKFSAKGGMVQIELSTPIADSLRIMVTDQGIGIPPERREHIFDRFYQAHGTGYLGGMGLGLYISRQIIDLHGGQIRAEFPPEGGTRFVVQLPWNAV